MHAQGTGWFSRFHQTKKSWDLLGGGLLLLVAFVFAWVSEASWAMPALALFMLAALWKLSGLGIGAMLLALVPLVFFGGSRETSSPYLGSLKCGTGNFELMMLSPFVFGGLALLLWAIFLLPKASRVRRMQASVLLAVCALGASYNAIAVRSYGETFDEWRNKHVKTLVDPEKGASLGNLRAHVELRSVPSQRTATRISEETNTCHLIIERVGSKERTEHALGFAMEEMQPVCRSLSFSRADEMPEGLWIIGPANGDTDSTYVFRGTEKVLLLKKDVHGPYRLPEGMLHAALGSAIVGVLGLLLAALRYRKSQGFVEVQHQGGGELALHGAGSPHEQSVYHANNIAGLAPGVFYVLGQTIADQRPQAVQYRSTDMQLEVVAYPEAHVLRLRDHVDGALLVAAGAFGWAWALFVNHT
jgi:hypothetical protein